VARPHKPFVYRGWWVSKIAGKLTNLVPAHPDDGKIPPAAVMLKLSQVRLEQESCVLGQDSTVAEVVRQYLARPQSSDRTKSKNRHQLARFLQLFGERKVSTLRVSDADAWHAAVKHLKPSSYNGMLKTVRAVINFASSRQLFSGKNPFLGLKLASETGRQRTITQEEFDALLAVASVDQKELLYCLRYTVSRPQDWEANWSCWDGAVLTILAHKTAYAIGAKIVDIPPVVQDILSARRLRVGKDGSIFPAASLSFVWFRNLVKLAGLLNSEHHPSGENLTPYSLRHTCVTEAMERGASVKQLMALGSWRTPAMAMRYCHVRDRRDLLGLIG